MKTKSKNVLIDNRVQKTYELKSYEHIDITPPRPWYPIQVLMQKIKDKRSVPESYDEDATLIGQVNSCLVNLSK